MEPLILEIFFKLIMFIGVLFFITLMLVGWVWVVLVLIWLRWSRHEREVLGKIHED